MAGPASSAKVPTGTSGAYGVFRATIPNGQKALNTAAPIGSWSPKYTSAVQAAFNQASPAAKAAIVAGARANPSLPSSKVLIQAASASQAKRNQGSVGHDLGNAVQFVTGLLSHGSNVTPAEQRVQQVGASKAQLSGMEVSAKLAQQTLALPKTIGEGTLATGKAVVHDAAHPLQTFEHPLHSATFQLGKQMVEGDPWVNLIKTGNASSLANNPLGAILDVGGVSSLAGKAAEAGALGDAAKAAMERPDVVVPGTNTRLIRPNYSTSLPIHLAQRLADLRATDRGGALGHESTRYFTNPVQAAKHGAAIDPQAARALAQRVDENYFTGHANQTRATANNLAATDAAAKLLDGIPGGHELVGHLEEQLPHNHAAAEKLMQDNLAMWQKSLQEHKDAGGQLKTGSLFGSTPEANLQQNITSMEQGLNLLHNDPAAFDRVVEAAKIRQAAQHENVSALKAEQAVSDPAQLERRRVLPYAQRELGAVHTDTLTDKPFSEAGQAMQHLDGELKDAFAEQKSIGRLGRPETVDHPDVKPYANNLRVTRAQLKAAKARLSEAKGPIRKANLAQRVDALKQLRDEQVRDLRTRQLAVRSDVTDRIKGLQDTRSSVSGPKYLNGWVVPAEHAPANEAFQQASETGAPIGGISPLGREYVPLDTQAALQHAEQHGITPGYLAAGHSTEEALQRIKGAGGVGKGVGRGGTTQRYLGDSYLRGTANRTLAGSHDSALAGIRQIARAAEHDRSLRDFGLVDANGTLRTFPADAQGYSDAARAAEQFTAEHPGFKISVVPRYPDRAGNTAAINDIQDVAGHAEDPNQRLALVHDQALERMAAHEERSKLIPGLGMVNQIWRGGVLPFSPNYLQAVPQEGLVRTAIAGINPMRTLPGFSKLPGLRANHLDDLMTGLKHAAEDPTVDPATRAMYRENHSLLQNLSGGGLNFGAQDQVLRETLDKLRGRSIRDVSEAKRVATGLQRLVMKPGQWQLKNMHALENMQSRAVLNDWVKDAEKTQGSMEAVVKALGDGKNGANLAATAGHRMNEVLGNYIHRTPFEQTLIRNFTPFLSWYKNAVKFMYVTMPRDHPIMTQFMYNVGVTNAQAWQQDHANLPAFLSTDFLGTNYGNALETVGGVDPLRNTPAGIGEQSPLTEGPGLFEPSIMPLAFGMLGLDSFGKPIPSNQYGHSIQPGSTQALTQGVLPNALSEVPYYNLGAHIVKGVTGTQSKADVVSHNAAIRAIEEVFGGSMMPKNYSVYNHARAGGIHDPFGGGAPGGGSALGGGGALGGGSAF